MKSFRPLSVSLLLGAAALAMVPAAGAKTPTGPTREKNVTVMVFPGSNLLKPRSSRLQHAPLRSQQLSLSSYGPPVRVESHRFRDQRRLDQAGGQGTIPVWTFDVTHAGRDGLNHVGAIVGTNPFTDPGTSRVPTLIVPLIIRTHTIGVGVTNDPNTGNPIFVTSPGARTINSTAIDTTCLPKGNDVPSQLVYQSPIFQDAPFSFGGVFMGDTQYIDAIERASFYGALGANLNDYHVLFDPVQMAQPITIDVPANEGLAFSAQAFGGCGVVQILDINWFDSYVNGTLLPELAAQGMSGGTIPVFFLYNAVLASPVTQLDSCCILGYHSLAGEPTPNQVYAVSDFDSSGIFGQATENTAVLAHEMGELVNDPYTDNEVPPWGNSGQTVGCQENLEVGDPLTGLNNPSIKMPNGFTYNLQELTFFSWFFGGRSLGVNGWYSSNGTFTSDAGPVCGDPSITRG